MEESRRSGILTTVEKRCRCSVSDGQRASKEKTGISQPWLYPKQPNPRPPVRMWPRKMNRGYWLPKWTNVFSLPTRQSLAVLSCGEEKETSSEWMESPTSKTSTSTTIQRLKMTTTTMQQHTSQEEKGQPYPKKVARSKEETLKCRG